jgi:hypothetical protein
MAIFKGSNYALTGKVMTFAQLTAPGATADTINMVGCKDIVFSFLIASIDTNVVVRAEGSLDGTNYFNLASADTTILANGTYSISYAGILQSSRASFISEAGGTAATVDISAKVGVQTNYSVTEIYDSYTRGATGMFHEQADTPFTITSVATGETDVLNLASTSTRYALRSLIIKSADPGANTVTVRLYMLVNDISTQIDSFAITTSNYASYFCLWDLFGSQEVLGDTIQVTVRSSAGSYAITGQYSYAKNNV